MTLHCTQWPLKLSVCQPLYLKMHPELQKNIERPLQFNVIPSNHTVLNLVPFSDGVRMELTELYTSFSFRDAAVALDCTELRDFSNILSLGIKQ